MNRNYFQNLLFHSLTYGFSFTSIIKYILVKDEEGWKAYEVKSSTKVSDTYNQDDIEDVRVFWIDLKSPQKGARLY